MKIDWPKADLDELLKNLDRVTRCNLNHINNINKSDLHYCVNYNNMHSLHSLSTPLIFNVTGKAREHPK